MKTAPTDVLDYSMRVLDCSMAAMCLHVSLVWKC